MGWYTLSSGGTKVESTDVPTGDGTIYAHWANSQFEADSWATIKTNVHNGTTSAYHVGDTKTIDLGTSGTHTVRISNMSTPTECSTSGFSQSACGFVVEFTDFIAYYRMNTTSTSVGGYEASIMRTFLNDTIYNKIIATTGDIVALTTVVTGYENGKSSNYTTEDYVYLLTTHEVWTDSDNDHTSGPDFYDKGYANTRQLDYYANNNVTTSNYSAAIKGNDFWWLRGTYSSDALGFFLVSDEGEWESSVASQYWAVSPAFRIV